MAVVFAQEPKALHGNQSPAFLIYDEATTSIGLLSYTWVHSLVVAKTDLPYFLKQSMPALVLIFACLYGGSMWSKYNRMQLISQ